MNPRMTTRSAELAEQVEAANRQLMDAVRNCSDEGWRKRSVCEGWSVGVLWREVQECYCAWVDGRPPALPALTHQFREFCAWQRTRYAGERRARALAYGGRQLDGVRPLDLAIARLRPPRQTFTGKAIAARIEAAIGASSGALAGA